MLAGAGSFTATQTSLHTITNAGVIQQFLPVAIDIRKHDAGCFEIGVRAVNGAYGLWHDGAIDAEKIMTQQIAILGAGAIGSSIGADMTHAAPAGYNVSLVDQ